MAGVWELGPAPFAGDVRGRGDKSGLWTAREPPQALDFADGASLLKAKERKTRQAQLRPHSSQGHGALCVGSPRAARHENPMLALLLIKLAR